VVGLRRIFLPSRRLLLFLKVFRLGFGGLCLVMRSMVVMPMGNMRMIGGLLLIALGMVFRGLAMMMGRAIVVFGGLAVVFVFRH
jgi:hypothetical protein